MSTFGPKIPGSVAHVLSALHDQEKIPLHRVENMRVSKEFVHETMFNPFSNAHEEIVIARWMYFPGMKYPVFQWLSPASEYAEQYIGIDDFGKFKPMFRPVLTPNNMPGFTIKGKQATVELYNFLSDLLTCRRMDDPRYQVSKGAGAFFQGGFNDPNGEWFLIEFWNSKGADAWIDYVNQHYQPSHD